MRSRLFPLLICSVISTSLLLPQPILAATIHNPVVSAGSAIVIDGSSGRVLWARNAEKERPMASTTKVMTAIVAILHGHLQELAKADKAAETVGESSMWLRSGDKHTVEELLYGLLLVSGNDAAITIAEHVGGSLEGFVGMMNAQAQKMGLRHTHFANPHGLTQAEHYTSAHDLASMGAYGLKLPEFAKIVSTRYMQIDWPRPPTPQGFSNKNKLLYNYVGANGIKTGYTVPAGKCLVAAAKRDGMQLVAVVLGSNDIWSDSRALLDYGFANYHAVRVVQSGEAIRNLSVHRGKQDHVGVIARDNLTLALRPGEKVEKKVQMVSHSEAPVKVGQKVGTMEISLAGQTLAKTDLVAKQKVERQSLWDLIANTGRGALTFMAPRG